MVNLEYESVIPRWRAQLWKQVLDSNIKSTVNSLDIYLFGVFAGQSTVEWINIFKQSGVSVDRILLFDSFQGIPKEEAEPVQPLWDPERSGFYKAFNASDYWQVSSVETAMDRFREKVYSQVETDIELVFVPGFFEDSLTDDIVIDKQLRPAYIVDVDVDIYTSAKQAMDWLIRNDLLLENVTQVGYDDWGGTPGYMKHLDGESRAHKELSDQYGLNWSRVTGTRNDDQIIFRYLGKNG
jgi:hypothetical protein